VSKRHPARFIVIGPRPIGFEMSGMMPGETPLCRVAMSFERLTTRSQMARDRRRVTMLRWADRRARRHPAEVG
jgi:hypothetical protein